MSTEIKGVDFSLGLGRPCRLNEAGTACAVDGGDCKLRYDPGGQGKFCAGRNDGSTLPYYEATLWVSKFSVIDTIEIPAPVGFRIKPEPGSLLPTLELLDQSKTGNGADAFPSLKLQTEGWGVYDKKTALIDLICEAAEKDEFCVDDRPCGCTSGLDVFNFAGLEYERRDLHGREMTELKELALTTLKIAKEEVKEVMRDQSA